MILEDGAFNSPGAHPCLKFDKGKLREFVIASGETTATDRDLTVTQKDIRSIQLAKVFNLSANSEFQDLFVKNFNF